VNDVVVATSFTATLAAVHVCPVACTYYRILATTWKSIVCQTIVNVNCNFSYSFTCIRRVVRWSTVHGDFAVVLLLRIVWLSFYTQCRCDPFRYSILLRKNAWRTIQLANLLVILLQSPWGVLLSSTYFAVQTNASVSAFEKFIAW